MNTSDIVFASVMLVALVVAVAVSAIPSVGRITARSFSRRVGLEMPTELADGVRRRVTRRLFAGAIGSFVGTIAAVALLSAGTITPLRDYGDIWFVLGTYFTGLAVGTAVSAVTERPSTIEARPRLARPGAVTVADYIAPIDRIGARVVTGLAVAALLASVLVALSGGEGLQLTTGVAIVALGVASLVFFELASRRIVGRGQPVGSPAELAWDDALRASARRDIATAPIVLGFWGVILLATELASVPGATGAVTLVALAVLIASGFAVALVSLSTRPAQHYLRRLWPDVAAEGERMTFATAQANTPGSTAR